MYLGEVLILLGAWVLMGAVSPVVAVGAYAFIADRWFVRAEEAILIEKFGQDYRDYCRKTRRWI
jgi:protein-S-isoprenylcysteine O-methyltransferase Ste14